MAEAGDPGRHERLVTVEDYGKTIRPSKRKNEDVLLLYSKLSERGSLKPLHIQKTLVCRYM